MSWDGWGGWDDNVFWTCTHSGLRISWDGWGGVGGIIVHHGLAHILDYGWDGWDGNVFWTCTHSGLRISWDGWGGVPWTCTHTSLYGFAGMGGVGGWVG